MEKINVQEEDDVFYSPEREGEGEGDGDTRKDMVCDTDEKRKIELMRTIVEKQDPSCKEIDDLTLRRFLRARNLNVEKAAEMFMKYVRWRRTFVPKGYVSETEIANELAQNKLFIQGKDKNGCPVGVLLAARHIPRKDGLDELKRLLVFLFDRLCSRIPEGQEKYTYIADMKGYGYSNSDIRGAIAAFSILQDYYPERLGRLFMVNVPYVFMALWKVIYPFIDKNTRKKIVFVEDKKLHDTLREYVDDSQLPDIYGGKLKLVPIQEA